MGVTLIPAGFLRNYVGGQDRLELAAGPTVAEMLETVGIPPALVAAVVQGTEIVSKAYRPRDGETIKVIAVMGGG